MALVVKSNGKTGSWAAIYFTLQIARITIIKRSTSEG